MNVRPIPVPVAIRAGVLLAVVAAPLASCSFHDVDTEPTAPVAVPDAFGQSDARTEAVRPTDRWWADFGDERLDTLVEQVLGANLDLKQAWARLDQARALADQGYAGYWPQLEASVAYNRSQQNFFFGGGGPLGGGESIEVESESFPISLGAAYEVDLWGRVGHVTAAGDLEVEAGRADLEGMAMSLVAQVAEVYYGIAEQEIQRELLSRQDAANRMFLELIELRLQQGAASALDFLQQKQQIASIETQLPLVELRLRLLRHQLAVLLGRPPSAELPALADAMPDLPPVPSTGVPAELLDRRPDVRSARLRVVAADHRVGAAIADRFPALRLSANTGFMDREISSLFSNWVWNIGASLVAPLFDGGRRSAEVERNRAVVDERVQAYGKTVLIAFKEVEDALVQEQQRIYLGELERQLELGRATLDEAKARFQRGLTDYLPVLTALRTHQQIEFGHIAAKRQLVSYRIQLYRALGGTWASELQRESRRSAEAPRTNDGEGN